MVRKKRRFVHPDNWLPGVVELTMVTVGLFIVCEIVQEWRWGTWHPPTPCWTVGGSVPHIVRRDPRGDLWYSPGAHSGRHKGAEACTSDPGTDPGSGRCDATRTHCRVPVQQSLKVPFLRLERGPRRCCRSFFWGLWNVQWSTFSFLADFSNLPLDRISEWFEQTVNVPRSLSHVLEVSKVSLQIRHFKHTVNQFVVFSVPHVIECDGVADMPQERICKCVDRP